MDRIAFVFPGQGSQSVGMGKALVEASPAAAAILAEADDALGESISRLAFDGPAEQLDLTVNAQPALVAVSIAYLAALRERWAAVRHRRARARPTPPAIRWASTAPWSRPASSPSATPCGWSGSAAGRCRPRARVDRAPWRRSSAWTTPASPSCWLSAKPHGSVTVANRNSPGQIVISGDRAAVEAAVAGVKELGARRGILLPVSVAAHSALMAEAAEGMARVLAPIAFGIPRSRCSPTPTHGRSRPRRVLAPSSSTT